MYSTKFKFSILTAAVMAVFAPFNAAKATNGYFSTGYGVGSKGMVGAGVAMSEDTLSGATNPAAMVHLGNRVDVGLSAFNPNREINATAGGAVPAGVNKSTKPWFLIPEFGINRMLDEDSSVGITFNANGGMNTDYVTNPFRNFTSNIDPITARTGVDLGQALLGVTYARKFGAHSFGITPTFAIQYFSANGLQPFQGVSSAPGSLTNRGYDFSAGYGFRLGYQGEIGPNMKVGLGFQSRMYMQRFKKYRGLFADGGSFDIPPSLTAGVAFTVPESKLTIAADFQTIFYSQVDSIANSGASSLSTCSGAAALGRGAGCGFGWDNQQIVKIGAKYAYSDKLTLRAGASVNTQVYENGEILFNILAPAVVRKHASVGATYNFMKNQSLSFSYTRAFLDSISGGHPSNASGSVKHQMDQNEIAVGYTYKW